MDDPIALLSQYCARAAESEQFDATRAALATANEDGRPSVRFVLVRQIEAGGLYFYTNYESDKARDLAVNPHASLAWHWWTLGIQVRAEGPVERASAERSDAYFDSRALESQLGAWASDQSRPLASREDLDERLAALQKKYAGKAVPRPPHWGGFVLDPTRIELWHNRDYRLHDRFRYDRDADGWQMTRLAP